jgi:hypothetical protein
MSCPRCDNLMVEETFVDLESDVHPLSFRGWRCVICGAIVDSLIVLHQTNRPEPLLHQPRTRKLVAWGT